MAECTGCLHMKCLPGWWDKNTAVAHCEEDLFNGKGYVKRPFMKGHRAMLEVANNCPEFDDMREE